MRLSVIVIDDCEPESLARCLESLNGGLTGLRETAPEWPAEVLVVPMDPDGSPIRAWGRALAESKGDVVAFLDARYRVTPVWAQAIVDAHEQGGGVVGGRVGLARASSVTARAIYLWEYCHIAPPLPSASVPPREASWFAGRNTSYKRQVLLNSNMASYGSELDLDSALASQGVRFFDCDQATVEYVPPALKVYLKERFRVSCSQAMQSGASKSPLSRVLNALARALALAPWLLVKRGWRVAALGSQRTWLILVLPWFCVFAATQAAGEVIGYLRRPAAC
jgi:hypothetical protein